MSKVEEEKVATASGAAEDTRMPTFYISHGGGPCFFMKPKDRAMFRDMGPDSPLANALRAVSDDLPSKPKALLIISAHWETRDTVAVTTGAKPDLLFDYYGFPDYTYKLKWPAPGDPALAARVRKLLEASSIPSAEEPKRGYDHGVFVPMLLAYPDADVPTVVLSLRADLDPEFHVRMGEALAPLRDEGVLIIGSGFSSHGFGGRRLTHEQKIKAAADFNAFLVDTLDDGGRRGGGGAASYEAKRKALVEWESAPGARGTHPREEHLIPLHVALGAGGDGPSRATFNTPAMGFACTMFRFG